MRRRRRESPSAGSRRCAGWPRWPRAMRRSRRCAGARAGPPVPVPMPGTAGILTPTTMPVTSSTLEIRPIVETGMLLPSVVTCPDGNVRLFAARTPVTWASDTPFAASLSGSRVIRIRCSSPPVTSTLPTPSMPRRAGWISFWVTSAAAERPFSVVAAMDAMMTGEALMFRAVTWGVTEAGRPAFCRFCSMAARISFTSEPNENCATTRASELADVDCRPSRRGTPEMARSIGLVTCSATSAAPAPGSGAMTVMTGNSMSGSSSCLRLPQAKMPAMKSAPASRSVTLRLETANSERRLMRDPFAGRMGRGRERVGRWAQGEPRPARAPPGHPARRRARRRRRGPAARASGAH